MLTTYQLDAMRVACPICKAPKGEPCASDLETVPESACRIHVTRAIRADYTREI